MCVPLTHWINLRAEGPSFPEVSSTKGMMNAGGKWKVFFDSAVVVSF